MFPDFRCKTGSSACLPAYRCGRKLHLILNIQLAILRFLISQMSHLSFVIINNLSASIKYLITTDQKTNENQACLTSVLAGRRVVSSPWADWWLPKLRRATAACTAAHYQGIPLSWFTSTYWTVRCSNI